MLNKFGLALAGVALMGATVATDVTPVEPAQAIALANAAPKGQAIGLFKMKIAAVGTSKKITFLNSNADYRSEGNLTFSLSQSSAAYLAQKAGVANVSALVGREIIVAGRIEKRQIVNVGADGRQIGHNRWAYSVRIDKPDQLVSISAQ